MTKFPLIIIVSPGTISTLLISISSPRRITVATLSGCFKSDISLRLLLYATAVSIIEYRDITNNIQE